MAIKDAIDFIERNQVKGWLQQSAAEALWTIANGMHVTGRPICEIGIHHGKTAIFLSLLTDGPLIGYDLFEMQEQNVDESGRGDLQIFLKNAAQYGLGQDSIIAVSENSLNLTADHILEKCGQPPVFFSVDGGHTAETTRNDLRLAATAVASDGVVLLDDFFNQNFSEVSWATAEVLLTERTELFPFCISGQKIFFARKPDYADQYFRLLTIAGQCGFKHTVESESVNFFGRQVFVMKRLPPATSVRSSLTRTRLWKSIRHTPVGAIIRAAYKT